MIPVTLEVSCILLLPADTPNISAHAQQCHFSFHPTKNYVSDPVHFCTPWVGGVQSSMGFLHYFILYFYHFCYAQPMSQF